MLEVFGPLTCVYGYRKLDEAIRIANSLPYAFQASIFSVRHIGRPEGRKAPGRIHRSRERPHGVSHRLDAVYAGVASRAMASAAFHGRWKRWPTTRWWCSTASARQFLQVSCKALCKNRVLKMKPGDGRRQYVWTQDHCFHSPILAAKPVEAGLRALYLRIRGANFLIRLNSHL